MDAPQDLLTPAVAARLEAARQGDDVARWLTVAELRPGRFGVLDVEVRMVHAGRTFQRRGGGEGSLRRVTVGDDSGEIDLVLWGSEERLATEGPLATGSWVRLRGATVKDGYRGGYELALGVARVEPLPDPTPYETLEGDVAGIGETRVIGSAPDLRFEADVWLQTAIGQVTVVLGGTGLKAIRQTLPGARVRIDACRPHRQLEGWFTAPNGRVSIV